MKGLSEPVEAVEVLWVPLGGGDTGKNIALPARLGIRPAVGVVGRQVETQSMACLLYTSRCV